MKLDSAFYRLPLRFDVDRLQYEAAQFAEAAWLTHPTGFAGNSALILISAAGSINDDFAISGQMAPTPHLGRCPYLRQVLASFHTPLSRSRLMRVAGGSQVPEHVDAEYHWFRRVRVHVPVQTHASVRFYCDGRSVHMAAGEAWIFDGTRPHRVDNPADAPRIHLVFDTRGSDTFWNSVHASADDRSATYLPYQTDVDPRPFVEPYRFEVLTQTEIESLTADIAAGALEQLRERPSVRQFLGSFPSRWAQAFSRYGHDVGGRADLPAARRRFRGRSAGCHSERPGTVRGQGDPVDAQDHQPCSVSPPADACT